VRRGPNGAGQDRHGVSTGKKYADFRKVFDHHKDFDAVVVSTCEHTHAFATMLALKHGEHVYCEKPLTYNISEARLIRETTPKLKLATQISRRAKAESRRWRTSIMRDGPPRRITSATWRIGHGRRRPTRPRETDSSAGNIGKGGATFCTRDVYDKCRMLDAQRRPGLQTRLVRWRDHTRDTKDFHR
jgi:predicted dehydrogenase